MSKLKDNFDNLGDKPFTEESIAEMRKMMKKFEGENSHWGLAYGGKAIVPITQKMAKKLTLQGLEEYLIAKNK